MDKAEAICRAMDGLIAELNLSRSGLACALAAVRESKRKVGALYGAAREAEASPPGEGSFGPREGA